MIPNISSEQGIRSNSFSHIGKRILHFFPSSDQVIRNINRIAVASIAVFTLSYIPCVEAGPIAWAARITACETAAAAATVATGGAASPSLWACVAACSPLLPLPFPHDRCSNEKYNSSY